MRTLKIEDIPEEGLDLKWAEDSCALSAYTAGLSRIDFGFETPLESEARIERIGDSLLIRGDVQTRLRLQCVRCLKEFSSPFASRFEVTMHPKQEGQSSSDEAELESEELESSFFEGGEIRLSEIACEQVFLEMPTQPLCREDCKGLCPVCGGDLNVSPCACVKQDLPSGFSDLKKLKLPAGKAGPGKN